MSATHCFESGTWRSFSYLSQKMNETVGPTARTMTDLNTTEANFAITPDSPGTLWRTSVIACIAAINIFLSISASLSNVLILISLQKVSTLHKPTKLLFQSLAVTDLFVGLILQPFHATFLLSLLTKMDTCKSNFLHWGNKSLCKYHALWGISAYLDSDQCWSTLSLVSRAAIQTGCYNESRSNVRSVFLADRCFVWLVTDLELPHRLDNCLHLCCALYADLDIFLH